MKEILNNIQFFASRYKDTIKSKNSLTDSEYEVEIDKYTKPLLHNLRLYELLATQENQSFRETIGLLKANWNDIRDAIYSPILTQTYLTLGYVIADELLERNVTEAINLITKLGDMYLYRDEMNAAEFMTAYFMYHFSNAFIVATSELSKQQTKQFKEKLKTLSDNPQAFLSFVIGVNLTDKILYNEQQVLPSCLLKKYNDIKFKLFYDFTDIVGMYLAENIEETITYERVIELTDEVAHILNFLDIRTHTKLQTTVIDKAKDIIFSHIKTNDIEFMPSDAQFEKYMMFKVDGLRALLNQGIATNVIPDVIKYKQLSEQKNVSEVKLEPKVVTPKKSMFFEKYGNNKEFKITKVEAVNTFKDKYLMVQGVTDSCEILQKVDIKKTQTHLYFKSFCEYNLIPHGVPYHIFKQQVNTNKLQKEFRDAKYYMEAFKVVYKAHTKHHMSFNSKSCNKQYVEYQKHKSCTIVDLFPDLADITEIIKSRYTSKLLIDNPFADRVALLVIKNKENTNLEQILTNINFKPLYEDITKIDIRSSNNYTILYDKIFNFLKPQTDDVLVVSCMTLLSQLYLFEANKSYQDYHNLIQEMFTNFELTTIYTLIQPTMKTLLSVEQDIDNMSLSEESEKLEKIITGNLLRDIPTDKSIMMDSNAYLQETKQQELTVVEEKKQNEEESPTLRKKSVEQVESKFYLDSTCNDPKVLIQLLKDREKQLNESRQREQSLQDVITELQYNIKAYEDHTQFLEEQIKSKLSGEIQQEDQI